MFTQQRFFTNRKEKQIRGIGESSIYSEQLDKYNSYRDQQTDRDNIFQILLYCDQPLACYMHIHNQFKVKATGSAVDLFRSSSKKYALIDCWMQIEQHGKITLCSRQNKYFSSQFRVRFVNVRQMVDGLQLIMVSQFKGSEIKLKMQINSYYFLMMELNQNKIRYYSEPLISISEAWHMIEKYVGGNLQWVCACIFEGLDNCFVVRVSYRLFIYRIQRTKIELVHVIGGNQSLREKLDREWCFIGQKWISFRSISDRQLYKIYFTCLTTQIVPIQKTEHRQVEDKQLSNHKYFGSRHTTQVNSVSSKTPWERMEDKIDEDESKQVTVHKKLSFSMKKAEVIIQHSQRQVELGQEEQVIVDESERIIVEDNQFDQQLYDDQQHEKGLAEQSGSAIDQERADQQIYEELGIKQHQEVEINIQQIKMQQRIQQKQEGHQGLTRNSKQESIIHKVSIAPKISWSNHKSNRKEVEYYDKENCSKAANSINRDIEFKELKIEEQHMSISEVSEQLHIAMDQQIMHENQSSDSNLFGFEVIVNSHSKSKQNNISKQQDDIKQEKCSAHQPNKLQTIIKSGYFLRNTNQQRVTSPQKHKYSRTHTQHSQPSTKLHQASIIQQAASAENYIADVMQIGNNIFAVLNFRHQLMLCQSDKHYEYNSNGVKLNWKRQVLNPTYLFPSLVKQHLNYLQNSTKSIFRYDFNKQKHAQLIKYGLLVEHNQIRDVQQTNHDQYVVITPSHIKFMDSRLQQFKSRKDLSYRTQHKNFQKLVMQSPTTAVVCQSDGIVKIFDLRASSLRALNRLVLDQTNKANKQEGSCSQIKIVQQTQDIFCTYNNSSYVIASQTINSQHSIYQRTAKYAERRLINQFKLTTANNQKSFYDIGKAGHKIIHWEDGVLKYCETSTHNMKTLWWHGGDVGYVGFDMMGEGSEMRREDVVWCEMGIGGITFRRWSIE